MNRTLINWMKKKKAKKVSKDSEELPIEKASFFKKAFKPTVLNGVEGCYCDQCEEFYPYAEPTKDDGKIICYKCRVENGIRNE
jgi:formylmethanofuran dehydrogenase subunit E